MDNGELVDSVESMDSVDSLAINIPHESHGRGIGRGIGFEQQEAVKPQFHEFHGDSIPTQNNDLFSDGVPSGLNAGQWERARYAWGLGRFKEFADVARESGMDYAKLKLLVEGATT